LTSKAEKNTISIPRKHEQFFQWPKESGAESGLTLTLKLIVDIDELSPDIWVI
jgi:hypothetical protein